jgi:3-hydroxyacyl-CoA dehydrogenase
MALDLPVAIVGTGLIGRAWAIAFARAGCDVRLFDPTEGAVRACLDTVGRLIDDLEAQDLLDGQTPGAVSGRMRPTSGLAEALEGVAWVQENAPERVEVKRSLWAEMDRLAPADAILASSTSAILPSRFTEDLKGRGRCLVCHPLNPPYAIPAVELVPAPWTERAVMTRAAEAMRTIGQVPIVMRKELEGFVMNRLQAALVEEAFKLVAGGYCDAEDVDVGLREGLALRWCFMGPFETGDLNAPGGIRDYATRYRSVFDSVLASALPRPDWSGPVLDEIEAVRAARLPRTPEANAERQRWRDRRLMALARHKRQAKDEIGD